MAPATQASSSPLVTSLAQWVWLLEFDSSLAALDASALRTGELAGALVPHFDAVHVVRPDAASLEATTASARRDGWQPATATVAPLTAITLEQGSLDCIAVHDLFVRQPRSTACCAPAAGCRCPRRIARPCPGGARPRGAFRAGGLNRCSRARGSARYGASSPSHPSSGR